MYFSLQSVLNNYKGQDQNTDISVKEKKWVADREWTFFLIIKAKRETFPENPASHHNTVTVAQRASLWVKQTIMNISIIIISINWIVSSFCWSPIRFDVWGEYEGHRGLCMMYYWMEINGSLFCQLLLAISPTICCLLQKEEELLFRSLSLPVSLSPSKEQIEIERLCTELRGSLLLKMLQVQAPYCTVQCRQKHQKGVF